MVFIWTGRGYWGVVFPALFAWLVGFLVSNTFGQPLVDANGWMFGVAVLVAAAANWAWGRRWNGTEGLKPWDVKAALRYRRDHTIFNMPMELWSYVLVVIGIWMIVVNLPGMPSSPA